MNKLISLFSVKRLIEVRAFASKLTADGKEIPKNKTYETRITLIGPDNSVSITDLKNAQNVSLRRELKLVKVQDVDSKTRRPVYKLMTKAEYHEEELQKRKEKQAARQSNSVKGEKMLTLSSKIGEHDLMTGVKKMMKLLQKQYEVRIVIAGEGEVAVPQLERIYSVIEENIKSYGKVVQKRNKGNDLKFQLIPNRKSSESSELSQESRDSNKQDGNGPL